MNERYQRQRNNALLLQYAEEGQSAYVLELLQVHLSDNAIEVNCVREGDFSTPLHLAVESGDLFTVNALIQSGSHLDQRRKDGKTPLYLAAENNYVGIADLLLNAGACTRKTAVTDLYEKSPLAVANERNHKKIVNLLLEYSAPASGTGKIVYLKTAVSGYLQ